MRIIKSGKKPENEVYRVTCRHCRCMFEFKGSEGRYESSQRDGDFIRINCPECGTENYAYPKNDR